MRKRINPYIYRAIVFFTVAVACYALLLLKIYIWEEELVFNVFTHERIADMAVVAIVVIAAYILYERLVKSID